MYVIHIENGRLRGIYWADEEEGAEAVVVTSRRVTPWQVPNIMRAPDSVKDALVRAFPRDEEEEEWAWVEGDITERMPGEWQPVIRNGDPYPEDLMEGIDEIL